jgi:hypothetical protein
MMTARMWVCAALIAIGTGAFPVAAQSSCRPADETSARMLQWVKNIATATGPHAAERRTMTKIPQVSASQVTYVTSSTVCNKALSPYNAETVMQDATTGTPVSPSGQLYVVKAGTVYVVWDPVKSAGSYATYVTLDSKYKVLWAGIG